MSYPKYYKIKDRSKLYYSSLLYVKIIDPNSILPVYNFRSNQDPIPWDETAFLNLYKDEVELISEEEAALI